MSDLLDLIDVDGLRLLWHPSLAEHDLRPIHQGLVEGREHLTVLCVEGSIALAEDGMFDIAGGAGKFRIVRSLCERANYVLAMGACAGYGGWQAQPPNPSGAVGLQSTLGTAGGLVPPEWRSRKGLPVISVAGCPVPAETQASAIRWALEGAPGGLDRHGLAADGAALPPQHAVPGLRHTPPHRHALHRLQRPEIPQLDRPEMSATAPRPRHTEGE